MSKLSPARVMVMVMMMMMMMMIVSLQVYGYRSCIKSERKGLLEIKAYVNNSYFPYDWPNDRGIDCCSWDGVKCNLTSGHVTGLFLNDSSGHNSPPLNLSLLYPFGELHTLNLSNFWVGSWFDDIHGYESLGKLKKLEILDLRDNGVNNSVLPFLNAASSLKTLILHGNFFEGTFPKNELKSLRNLELLDLSWNKFTGPLPDLADFHNLQGLDLSNNEFSGSFEKIGICQLKNLRELDLSQNKWVGPLPRCFGSLNQLQVLDISSNKFNGRLSSLLGRFTHIEYLSLLDNEFEGVFSFELIANFSKLKVFKLSSRSSLMQVKTEITWLPRFQLSVLELQNCNLAKNPSFLQHQKDLRVINLSHNKLTGTFPSWFLEQYPKLEVMLLHNNSLTTLQLPKLLRNHNLRILDLSTNHLHQLLPGNFGKVFPNLKHLNLSNNGFQGNLPPSFGEMKKIGFLDLSHNNFSGNLPMNFLIGCDSLDILKISYNKFSGQIFPKPTNFRMLSELVANNNLFTGIADGLLHSKDIFVLDLSNNYLKGGIPSWFGSFSFLYVSVADNLLEGTLPNNLFNIPMMKMLDFSGNKFSGNLPSHFNGQYMSLLYLQDNEFNGTIPSTLLKDVLLLDLRNNKLSGTIPSFVNNQTIFSLLLRGNSLTGHIPTDLCGLRSIRILDLSHNRLNGSIPSCLKNISFGRNLTYDEDGYIQTYETYITELEVYSRLLVLPPEYSPHYIDYLRFMVEFASKRRYDSYTPKGLEFMFGLDLSSNDLSGEIPRELGDLQQLRALNLSHNSLSGLIPKSFSNLTDVESLDLSFNMMSGSIPNDLTKVDYMVIFNVSYNNMSGSVPNQGKFSTLDETNYIGNPFLCGSSVNRSCNDNNTTSLKDSDDETTIDMETFYWCLIATYSISWMVFIVFICFDSPWRQAWFRIVDAFIIWVKCV